MINKLITNAVSKAFDKQLSDAVTPFTGLRKGFGGEAGEYDPVSGEFVNASGESGDISYSGRGVLGKYNDFEIQASQIDINDIKLTVLQAEITTKPKVDDEITADGQTWRVLNVNQDPAKVSFSIQLRGLANVVG